MTRILRPYQEANVEGILEKLPIAEKGVVYAASTGAGKTVTFTRVVKRIDDVSWTFVHREELLEQTARAYAADGLKFALVSPNYTYYPNQRVIASIDTLLARRSRYADLLARARLLIFDEAHHGVANKWKTVRSMAPDAWLLGPTATPWRTNGEGLGDVFDQTVMAPSMSALIQLGWLAPPHIVKPDIKLPSFKGLKRRLGDYVLKDLSRLMNTTEINNSVVAVHKDLARDRPTIVFAVDIDHAECVARAFRAAGYKAGIIIGDMKRDDREAAAEGLKTGALDVLVSVDVISEGYDVPRCACIVLLRPTMSTGLFLQQIGRGLRPDDDFEDCLVLDVVGNSIEHGLPDEIRPWTLLDGARNMERMVMKPVRCGSCFTVQRPIRECSHCGAPMKLSTVESFVAAPAGAVNPDLLQCSPEILKGLPLKSLLRLGKTRADLEFIAVARGYSRKWVDMRLLERRQWASQPRRRA